MSDEEYDYDYGSDAEYDYGSRLHIYSFYHSSPSALLTAFSPFFQQIGSDGGGEEEGGNDVAVEIENNYYEGDGK